MSDGSLTAAERLGRIEAQLEAVLAIAHELDSRDRADMRRLDHHEQRITKLETLDPRVARLEYLPAQVEANTSWRTWSTRLVLGALITAAIAFVIAGGLAL